MREKGDNPPSHITGKMRERKDKLKVTAIVPSAGKGRRFGSKERKIFADLNKRPVLSYALSALQASPLIEDIILVIDGPLISAAEKLLKRYKIGKVKRIVRGGRTRTESVRRSLKHVAKDTALVLIHDGVRPFVSKEVIKKTIAAARRFGASISAVPVKSTIKASKKNAFVSRTLNRNMLWKVQTPQVFKRSLIVSAYKRIKKNSSFTDDAALLERAKKPVKIVTGDYNNIKITTPEDIRIAESLLRGR